MLGPRRNLWATTIALAVLSLTALHAGSPAHAGEIGNFVWEDLNADGIQDRSEPGYANARVELLDCNGSKLATTFTNSGGAYSFGQLDAGMFKIRFVLPTGYAFSPSEVASTTRGWDSNPDPLTGMSKCLSMTSSQSRQGIDAGIVKEDTGGTLETSWKGAIGGVTVDGNRISYSGTPTGWLRNTVNSGLLSSLGFSDEFEVRWTIDDNPANTVWIVGLGIDETSPDWTDVDFGFRSSNGLLEIRENGKWRTGGPILAKGNVLSIYVNNGTVDYRLNGSTIYSSTSTGAPDYYIDTSFKQGSVSFLVEVESTAMSMGSANLSWTKPTKNEDGSKLVDLAGYRVYWGKISGSFSDSVTLDDPGKTSYTIGGLTAGTYEFAVTSINSAGKESRLSTPATKVIQ